MPTKEQINHWRMVGTRLGYPLCCIIAFTNKPLASERDWPNPWEGTGYVPCPRCAQVPMLQTMGRINSRRDPSLPMFPTMEL